MNAGRMTRVASRQEDGYRHARLHLHAEVRRSRRVVGRRFVPPGILTSGPQPGRERPRVWNANLFPGPSGGVAHVLAAGVAATCAVIGEEYVVPIARPRRTHALRRRATRSARGAAAGRPGPCLDRQVPLTKPWRCCTRAGRRTRSPAPGRRAGVGLPNADRENRLCVVVRVRSAGAAGHHATEYGAVLGAVQCSSLRFDPPCGGPSDIDGACAQLRVWQLRDGPGVRPCGLADG